MKRLLKYIFIVLSISFLFLIIFFSQDNRTIINTEKLSNHREVGDIYILQEEYNNKEVIGIIKIPGVINIPFAKASNNEFYLDHDLSKKPDKNGSVFMDYRTNFEDRKILLYGHSGRGNLPFAILNKYLNKDFFDNNQMIYLRSSEKTYKYKVISSYIETNDFDYVNVNSFGGLSFEEHVKKLQAKSVFKTNYHVNSDSKILILQTCSLVNIGKYRFHIVVAVLEN